jgi:hypothetical protein
LQGGDLKQDILYPPGVSLPLGRPTPRHSLTLNPRPTASSSLNFKMPTAAKFASPRIPTLPRRRKASLRSKPSRTLSRSAAARRQPRA